MLHLIERMSSNSPVRACKSSAGFIISASLASQFKSLPSSGAIEEDIATGVETRDFFDRDISIWLRTMNENEYYIDESSNLGNLIAYFLSQIAEVNQIYLLKESENIFHVWSVIADKTQSIKKAIYERERTLIHYFKENLYFDFHIDLLSDIEHIRNTGAFLIFKRK